LVPLPLLFFFFFFFAPATWKGREAILQVAGRHRLLLIKQLLLK